jgi:hypothetical protein
MPNNSRKQFERDLTVLDRTSLRSFDSFEDAEQETRAYWRSRSPIERMIALEHIRQLAWGYDDSSERRLSRSSGLLKLSRRSLSGHRRVRSQLSWASS